MTAIRSTLRYLEISHARMEMGEVRFEASISIAPEDAAELGTRVEIKNLNSFRAVVGGVSYEIARQTKALEKGEQLHQETPALGPRAQRHGHHALQRNRDGLSLFPRARPHAAGD